MPDIYSNKLFEIIDTYRKLAPRTETIQATNETIKLLKIYTGKCLNEKIVNQIRDIVSAGQSVLNNDNIDIFIESGSINIDIVEDLRCLNSHGGKGEGYTLFDLFYKKIWTNTLIR